MFKDFPVDPADWRDPAWVATEAMDSATRFPNPNVNPDLFKAIAAMEKGAPVPQAFGDLGYDSIKFPHTNPYHRFSDMELNPSLKTELDSLLLFDESRQVNALSPTGKKIAGQRGILAAEPHPGFDADEMADRLSSGTALNSDEFLTQAWDPDFVPNATEIHNLHEQLMDTVEDGYMSEAADVLKELKNMIRNMSPQKISQQMDIIDGLNDPRHIPTRAHEAFNSKMSIFDEILREKGGSWP
jgi:hypothetical protein